MGDTGSYKSIAKRFDEFCESNNPKPKTIHKSVKVGNSSCEIVEVPNPEYGVETECVSFDTTGLSIENAARLLKGWNCYDFYSVEGRIRETLVALFERVKEGMFKEGLFDSSTGMDIVLFVSLAGQCGLPEVYVSPFKELVLNNEQINSIVKMCTGPIYRNKTGKGEGRCILTHIVENYAHTLEDSTIRSIAIEISTWDNKELFDVVFEHTAFHSHLVNEVLIKCGSTIHYSLNRGKDKPHQEYMFRKCYNLVKNLPSDDPIIVSFISRLKGYINSDTWIPYVTISESARKISHLARKNGFVFELKLSV